VVFAAESLEMKVVEKVDRVADLDSCS